MREIKKLKKVTILHGYTTEYRVPFFEELNKILLRNNIEMLVVIGQPSKFEKYDTIKDAPFFKKVKNRYLYICKKYFVWEPVFKHIINSDLIIIRQANKHLVNPIVFVYARIKKIKLGIWGNMKKYFNKNSAIFNPLIRYVDHWFAYNDITKQIIVKTGFPSNSITSINNAIDTTNERKIYHSIDENEISYLKNNLNIGDNDTVGIFCSRLYPDKRIDFLLETIIRVKKKFPNFKFIIIGDGSEKTKIEKFSVKNNGWFFWVGSQYGKDKIKYFKLADFQLIPGLVGLHIVDSFAFETPIITTKNNMHSVEIGYLKNFENGIICEDDINLYVEIIQKLFVDKDLIARLKNGCRSAANFYTIENMAQRFASGILKVLNE